MSKSDGGMNLLVPWCELLGNVSLRLRTDSTGAARPTVYDVVPDIKEAPAYRSHDSTILIERRP